MNDERYDCDDDLEIVDPQKLLDTYVLDDPEHERQYLRTRWIGRIMMQLIEERVSHGLTQRELGEKMGKPQSSIARLERGDDLKLSVLWEYLAAMGQTPEARLPLLPLDEERDGLSKYVAGSAEAGARPILRVQHWRTRPLSPDERPSACPAETVQATAGDAEEIAEDEKVAVA